MYTMSSISADMLASPVQVVLIVLVVLELLARNPGYSQQIAIEPHEPDKDFNRTTVTTSLTSTSTTTPTSTLTTSQITTPTTTLTTTPTTTPTTTFGIPGCTLESSHIDIGPTAVCDTVAQLLSVCSMPFIYSQCNRTCSNCTFAPSTSPTSSPTESPISTTLTTTLTTSQTSTASTTITTTVTSSATTTATTTHLQCADLSDVGVEFCLFMLNNGVCDPDSDTYNANIALERCQYTCFGCTESPTTSPTIAPTSSVPSSNPTFFPSSSLPTEIPTVSPTAPTESPTTSPTTSDTFQRTCPGGVQQCKDSRFDVAVIFDISGSNIRNLEVVRIILCRLIADLSIPPPHSLTNVTNRMMVVASGFVSEDGDNPTEILFDFEEGRAFGGVQMRREVNKFIDDKLLFPDGFGVTTSTVSKSFDVLLELLVNDSSSRPAALPVVPPIVLLVTDGAFIDIGEDLETKRDVLTETVLNTTGSNVTIAAIIIEPPLTSNAQQRLSDVTTPDGIVSVFARPSTIPEDPIPGSTDAIDFVKFFDALARNYIREAVCCEPIPSCHELDADILLLLDTSTSNNSPPEIHGAIRVFASALVEGIPLSPRNSRLGLVGFNETGASVNANFPSSLQLQAADILSLTLFTAGLPSPCCPQSGATQLEAAFSTSTDNPFIFGGSSQIPSKPHPIVIVVLSNQPAGFIGTGVSAPLLNSRQNLLDASDASIHVLGIGPGISPASLGQLQSIATADSFVEFVTDHNSASRMLASQLRNQFICTDISTDAPTQSPSAAPTISPSETLGNFSFVVQFGCCNATTTNGAIVDDQANSVSTGGSCYLQCVNDITCLAFEFDPQREVSPCRRFLGTAGSTLATSVDATVASLVSNGPGESAECNCFLRRV